jgi:uncharacterized RDD family membrane protein YckC
MLDTPRVVPTPEGIELTIRVAGPVTRARAWLIDLLIRAVIYIVLAITLSVLGNTGLGIFLVCAFLLEWLYPIYFEVYQNGATPGKRSCHLRTLHDNGTPIGWRASFTRNTLRAVDILPVGYGFGLIAMLLNRDFKRLGDLAAGTVVVYTEEGMKRKDKLVQDNIATTDDLRDAAPSLTMVEQRAMIDFAARQNRWSEDRQIELAMHAGKAINDASGLDAIGRVLALARHFKGGARKGRVNSNSNSNSNSKGIDVAATSDMTMASPSSFSSSTYNQDR